MRLIVVCLLLLGGCGALDAVENARSPAEAYYMLNRQDGAKNPYDHDPHYRQVYCTVGGIQYRASAAACADAGGKAVPAD